jgi:serine phosphatase RsbU (regulator of sigma subunit)
MANAAVLRPVDSSGRVQIVASRFTTPGGSGGEGPRFSRSLLAAASNGQVAELSGSGSAGMGNIAESIVVMNIASALCVPIMLGAARVEATPNAPPGTGGGTVALYLYLDSRGHAAPRPRANAAPFCVALGRMTGLALANLKRIEIERRQASIEADLNAAVAAQQWILPERTRQVGPVCYTGESRPGRFVGGDFFDVIDLGDGRVAVSLGDVCGKGMGACVLMTATQGFLHASLREHGDVQRALNAVNRYVSSRTPDERFVTAWVAVMDLGAGTLTYIDAGHGYALLRSDIQPLAVGDAPPIDMDATTPIPSIPVELRAGDGLPIGVEPAFNYRAATVALPASGRLMVVSDGVIEQTGIVQSPEGGLSQEEFGLNRLKVALADASRDGDTVADLFAAVVNHAGTTQLADDATAVLVRW